MKMQLTHALFAALTGSVAGHIHIVDPAPITAKENPNSGDATDYSINSPLADMSQFPCKGVLKYLGQKEGTPVATWAPGSHQTMKMGTGATHNGGSCQLSLSYDKGKTFKVIKSIIGNCPTQGGSYDFTVPSDAPEGEAAFSWSWINHTGNREFYQDCAAVTIGGGSSKREAQVSERGTSFNDLPDIFVANINNEWCVAEGTNVLYPDPGPDVDNTSNSAKPPTKCGSGGGDGGSATSLPGGGFITQTPTSVAQPTETVEPTSAPQPTTMSTSVIATPSSAPPTGASGELTGSCTEEGTWNCINGIAFQRCASGAWSAVTPMAAGTQCSPGQASSLNLVGRFAARRFQ